MNEQQQPARKTTCLEAGQLMAWQDGALPPREADEVRAHLAVCTRCATLERALMRDRHHVFADEHLALVRAILLELPERQQVCLVLRSIGFSYEEIAEATGISITSIGAVLARAMQSFRRSYYERTTGTE